jgi:hypothetical protein
MCPSSVTSIAHEHEPLSVRKMDCACQLSGARKKPPKHFQHTCIQHLHELSPIQSNINIPHRSNHPKSAITGTEPRYTLLSALQADLELGKQNDNKRLDLR